MRKTFLFLLTTVMVGTLFVGCGSKNVDQTKKTESKLEGEIVFATNKTDKADNVLTDMAKQFMALNPGVKIEVEGIKDIDQVLKTRMAAKEAPDVTPVLSSIPNTDYAKYFVPIDDLGFTKDSIYCYESGLSNDGKLYALTSGVAYNGIIYNKNVFKQAGITSIPKTMDEFYAACEKIKAIGVVPLATCFKDKWPLNWFAQDGIYGMQNTGNANYRNELKTKDKLLLDDGGTLAAFELLTDMNSKGYLDSDLMSAGWEATRKNHALGKVGMIFLGTWYPSQLVEQGAKVEDIGMFPFPGAKGILQNGNWQFAVSKNSKYPEVAKAFLKWLWEDGKYANASGVINPFKDAKIDDPIVAELLSFNVPIISGVPSDPQTEKILNTAEINITDALQDYMLAKNKEEVVKKYNEKWQAAKKSVMGN